MECILRDGNYPNLTELKLYNFNKAMVSRYFMDDFLFGHISKQQIADLVLVDLPSLKCFALTCYRRTQGYEIQILPLLRRLMYLEE
ncbi:unnamed protein product [Rotaria sp. Silwood1]|nr:unnamed protein product [Rotaria sp. Silwood1]